MISSTGQARWPLLLWPSSLLMKAKGLPMKALRFRALSLPFLQCHSALLKVVSFFLMMLVSSDRAGLSSSLAALNWRLRDFNSCLNWLLLTSRQLSFAGSLPPRSCSTPKRSAPLHIMKEHIVWSFWSALLFEMASRILSTSSSSLVHSLMLAAGHFTRRCSDFLLGGGACAAWRFWVL